MKEYAGSPSQSYVNYVIGVLMICWMFSFIDRSIISIIIDPIRKDLNLSEVEIGFIIGPAFGTFYIVFGLVMGQIADNWSRRNLIAFGVAAWSLATIACGLATDFWSLCIARALVGAGEAALAPAAYSMIPDYTKPATVGRALGFFNCGSSIGGGMALVAGGYIVQFASQGGLDGTMLSGVAGWRIAFFSAGLPGLLVALLLMLTVREPVRKIGSIAEKSIAALLAYLRAHGGVLSAITVGAAGLVVVQYTWLLWGPVYLMRVHGLSFSQVGLYQGLMFGLLGTAGTLLGGYLRDWFILRGQHTAPLIVNIIAAAVAAPMLITSFLIEHTILCLILFGVGSAITCMNSAMHGASVIAFVPSQLRGKFSALYVTVVTLAGLAIAPLITAFFTENVFGGEMEIGRSLAATCAIGAITTLVLLTLARPAAHRRAAALLAAET